MCGITGFWQRRALSDERVRERIESMTNGLVHRGPDDSGAWWDVTEGVALGHRRLSILDLSPEGRQPMVSATGRYVVTFNGEIYNFSVLRKELESAGIAPPRFRGHSDTEVLLACFEAWGVVASIERLVGMFAFAVWDVRERTLSLVRDRLGIKPLYVAAVDGGIAFGSELKALVAHPGFKRQLDRDSVRAYVQVACVPGTRCIYRNARKVAPGTLLRLGAPALESAVETAFWSAESVARDGLGSPFQGDDVEAVDEVERVLSEAIRLRMIADVPLGAFLSGGIDSSTVVALMQAQSSRPVRTFSIGNESAYYDESASAARVAAHLGTDHTELVVTAGHARDAIPGLARMYDEPFADSSQIPTFLVSKLARGSVTVALSGDGGDEVFGGYNRYIWGPPLWRALSLAPVTPRRWLAAWLRSMPPERWDKVFDSCPAVLPRVRRPGQQVHKLASTMAATSLEALYAALRVQWSPDTVRGIDGDNRAVPWPPDALESYDPCSRFMLLDLLSYLPDDILTKVDRASMAVGLEARVPLLDHRVVEFAWHLPLSMKTRGRTGKWALRQVLRRHVPDALVDRPKMGFIIPVGEWLRGPLRSWAEELLEPRRLDEAGIFDTATIRARLDEHLRGTRDWGQALWVILMFEQWRQEYGAEA